jgi:septum formation protein
VENVLKQPIILASSSPRRLYLMSQLHLSVETQRPNADEKPYPRERPQALVKRLARDKAESVAAIAVQKVESAIVIAADTIVVAPNNRTILNKPKDENDARKMLRMLSGKTHTVFTGYCILAATRNKKPKIVIRVVPAKVKMRSMTKDAIDRYVATGEPMDKAGAYAAQGMGMALIEKIIGSHTAVIGLPMAQVLADLEKFGIPLFGWINGKKK